MSGLGGSLWLVPDPTSSSAQLLREKIESLAADQGWGVEVAHSFSPHMTITSGITDYYLNSAAKVEFPGYGFVHLSEVQIQAPKLEVKEVVFGDTFFKRIFLRLERTESLLRLVSTLRSQFVGESQDSLDHFMLNFDPHISLAYASEFQGGKEMLGDLKKSLENFSTELNLESFNFIVLMDTRSPSSRSKPELVNDWKASPIRLSM